MSVKKEYSLTRIIIVMNLNKEYNFSLIMFIGKTTEDFYDAYNKIYLIYNNF